MRSKRLLVVAFIIVAAYIIGDLVKAWNESLPAIIEKKELRVSEDCWK